MLTITQLIQRHQHPLTWLYSFLFYMNFFVGLWLHNWLVIIFSLTGILAVTLFQPATLDAPAWAKSWMTAILAEWTSMPLLLRVALLVVSLVVTVILCYGLWQNSILLTALCACGIIGLKVYFLRNSLQRMHS